MQALTRLHTGMAAGAAKKYSAGIAPYLGPLRNLLGARFYESLSSALVYDFEVGRIDMLSRLGSIP